MVNIIKSDRKAPLTSDKLTEGQRQAVGYFFIRIKATDPREYDLIMPDEKTERIVKSEYAPYLMNFSKDQIDAGIAQWHELRQMGERDYQFLKIDRLIGLIQDAKQNKAVHKVFFPSGRLPEPEYQRQKRKAKGTERCAAILGMLDE